MLWTYIISDLNAEDIVVLQKRIALQKTNQKEFRVEKRINRKGNELCVEWKGYNNSFNSWIDRKVIV